MRCGFDSWFRVLHFHARISLVIIEFVCFLFEVLILWTDINVLNVELFYYYYIFLWMINLISTNNLR